MFSLLKNRTAAAGIKNTRVRYEKGERRTRRGGEGFKQQFKMVEGDLQLKHDILFLLLHSHTAVKTTKIRPFAV
jgi:hypothetical protein